MKPKNTWLLLALTAGLFSFIYFVERRLPQPEPVSNRVMGGFNPAGVTTVQIQPAGQLEIRVERGNGIWLMTKPVTYPARAAAIEGLVRAIAVLEHRIHFSAQELRNHRNFSAEYGLDNPQMIITLTDAGEQHLLKIGAFTAPGDQLYVQVVGQEGVDIIDLDSIKKYIPRRADDWRETLFLPPFNPADLDTLTVAAGQRQFVLQRDSTNTPWQMTSPVQSRADYPRINELIEGLKTLRVAAFVSDDSRADLESYGLQPPVLEMKLDHGTNRLASLQFGKTTGTNDSMIYARRNGQPSVVSLPREAVVAWQAGFQEFRDPRLARLDDSIVKRIDFEHEGDGGFYITRQPVDGNWMLHNANQSIPVTTNTMADFITLITNLQIARVNQQLDVRDAVAADTNSLLEFGLVKPSRKITFRGGSEKEPAAATNLIAELDFGTVKDGRVFVRRADRTAETSVYGIAADDFYSLPDSPLQFHEKRIWDFSAEEVSRVTVGENGKTREILHKGQNDWSLAPGSQGIIDKLQIQVGVQELGLLESAAWIQQGDTDRARFGFTATPTWIGVEIPARNSGPSRALKLEFGGVSPRGLRYGTTAMEDGQNWIFEVPKETMDRLTTYFGLPENPGT